MSDINLIYRWHQLALKVLVRGIIREEYDDLFEDNGSALFVFRALLTPSQQTAKPGDF
jgi:hypothetical protein